VPLTARGREILASLPGVAPAVTTDGIGCEIVRREELCIGCGRCVKVCPSAAIAESSRFDPAQLYDAPAGTTRGALGAALRRIARHEPDGAFEVPERVRTFRTIEFDRTRCLGCGACTRACPTGAVTARPVNASEFGGFAGAERVPSAVPA
jgi:ferredoxin